MKKVFSITFLLVLLGGLLSALEFEMPDRELIIEVSNNSFLTQDHVGSELTITGKLYAKKNDFVLTENAESRSAVTFNLVVKKWGLKRKLRKLDGQTVTLTGTLTQADATWTKQMKVQKIN